MRRMFRLPEADEDHLNLAGLSWETIVEGAARWLLVHAAPVAPGYKVTVADRAFSIDAGYPSSQIDMVYFHPSLSALTVGRLRRFPQRRLTGEHFNVGRDTERQPIRGGPVSTTYPHICCRSISGLSGSSHSDEAKHISSPDRCPSRAVKGPLVTTRWM